VSEFYQFGIKPHLSLWISVIWWIHDVTCPTQRRSKLVYLWALVQEGHCRWRVGGWSVNGCNCYVTVYWSDGGWLLPRQHGTQHTWAEWLCSAVPSELDELRQVLWDLACRITPVPQNGSCVVSVTDWLGGLLSVSLSVVLLQCACRLMKISRRLYSRLFISLVVNDFSY